MIGPLPPLCQDCEEVVLTPCDVRFGLCENCEGRYVFCEVCDDLYLDAVGEPCRHLAEPPDGCGDYGDVWLGCGYGYNYASGVAQVDEIETGLAVLCFRLPGLREALASALRGPKFFPRFWAGGRGGETDFRLAEVPDWTISRALHNLPRGAREAARLACAWIGTIDDAPGCRPYAERIAEILDRLALGGVS